MKDFFTEADCDVDVRSDWSNQRYKGISPITASRLLRERGRIVFAVHPNDSWFGIDAKGYAKYQALIINIEPIEQDSPEKILRDLVETADSLNQENPMMSVGYLVERAKKLLEKN